MHLQVNGEVEESVAVSIDMVPPTVNHYKKPVKIRTSTGFRNSWTLTDEALTFRQLTCVLARHLTVVPACRKELKKVRYGLFVTVYRDGTWKQEAADGDNYWKCIADALEHAGVIHNDNRVKVWMIQVEDGDPNPRCEVTAVRFKGRQ